MVFALLWIVTAVIPAGALMALFGVKMIGAAIFIVISVGVAMALLALEEKRRKAKELEQLTQPPSSCHWIVESVHDRCSSQRRCQGLRRRAMKQLTFSMPVNTPEAGVDAWRQAAQRTVRPGRIVVPPPVFNEVARLA